MFGIRERIDARRVSVTETPSNVVERTLEAASVPATVAPAVKSAISPKLASGEKDLLRGFSRVLSQEVDSHYFIESTDDRSRFCLLTDHVGTTGLLLVSQSHVVSHSYQSYKSRLELRADIAFKEERVAIDEIAAIYRNANAANAGANDEMRQKQMMGYIKEAKELGASDLRIVIQGDNAGIRYKVHGRSKTKHKVTRTEGFLLANSLYNSMCIGGDTNLNELLEQDAQLKTEYAHQAGLVGTRVATKPAKGSGLLLTLRLIPEANVDTSSLESAGYLPPQIEMLEYLIERPAGSVWFSGVTGAGKSTSLVVLLQMLQEREGGELDIITVEDPIESNMKNDGIIQTPLRYDRNDPHDVEKAWPRAIKSLMRHAPNVIMPGEVRDRFAAEASLDFTMTGHGVFTTIHVDRFYNIPIRLIEMGVNRSLVLNPGLVTGLINQALVRILCPKCKRKLMDHPTAIKPSVMKRLELVAKHDPSLDLDRVCIAAAPNTPCDECSGRTTSRRKVACEIGTPDATFMKHLRNDDTTGALRYFVEQCNGITKLAHAMTYLRAGECDPTHLERDVQMLTDDMRMMGHA